MVRRPSLPLIYEIEEPYPGVWLEEGDVVEAMYTGVYNEWHRITIVDLNVDASTYHLEYDDGEPDEDLCGICVRPYERLQVGQEVEVREEENETFYKRVVVTIHGDASVAYPGYTSWSDLEPEIKVGTRVEALYQRERVWYDAVVTKLRPDGMFDVLYDDGDGAPGKTKEYSCTGIMHWHPTFCNVLSLSLCVCDSI
jgi:hypothetical protein